MDCAACRGRDHQVLCEPCSRRVTGRNPRRQVTRDPANPVLSADCKARTIPCAVLAGSSNRQKRFTECCHQHLQRCRCHRHCQRHGANLLDRDTTFADTTSVFSRRGLQPRRNDARSEISDKDPRSMQGASHHRRCRRCRFCTSSRIDAHRCEGKSYRISMSLDNYNRLRRCLPSHYLSNLENGLHSTGVVVHGSNCSILPHDASPSLCGLMTETKEPDLLTTLSQLTVTSSCQQYIAARHSSCAESLSIRDTILAFIAANFDQVSLTKDFKRLSLEDMLTVIRSRYVMVPEKVLFERSMEWARKSSQSASSIAKLLENFRFALVPLFDIDELVGHSIASQVPSFSSILASHKSARPTAESSAAGVCTFSFKVSGLIVQSFALLKASLTDRSTFRPQTAEFYFTAQGYAWTVMAEIYKSKSLLQMGAYLKCLRPISKSTTSRCCAPLNVDTLTTTYRFMVHHACRGAGGGLRMCAASQIGTVDMMQSPCKDYAWWGDPLLLSHAQLESIKTSQRAACLSLDLLQCSPSSSNTKVSNVR